jgi:hypothetical protein
MPKKAGPKRLDPDTFNPYVFAAAHTNTAVLACWKRSLRGPDVVTATPSPHIHPTFLCFPAAIILCPSFRVATQCMAGKHVWLPVKPEVVGISDRCAKVALAEAWHGVEVNIDAATMTGDMRSNPEAWCSYRNGVRIRNVVTSIFWDEWNREGISLEERSERLTNSGYPCTPRQLDRFATNQGLDFKKAA